METADLDARSQRLDALSQKIEGPLAGLRLDILKDVITDLDGNPQLVSIFGEPVSSKLGIVAYLNDLRIVDAQLVELSEEQKQVFVAELEQTLARHMATDESQLEKV